MRHLKAGIPLALVFVALACMQRGPMRPLADHRVPLPCTGGSATAVWTDSLPIVSDTSLMHIVAGERALRYPEDPRVANRVGIVRARFVVDTAGRVVPGSAIIEASSDTAFARTLCDALPRLRFAPALIDGQKAVAGFVHVPFTFVK